MLFQGGAIVRSANTFLDAFKERDFVLKQNEQAVYYQGKVFWLNASVGRVEFARQLYNFLHVPGGDKEVKDTRAKIGQFKDKILKHNKEFPMKSFYTKDTQGTKRKRARTGDGGSAGAGAADCVLKAHGYEVKPEVVVDATGVALEPLFKA
ncbi:hypothetical protein BJV78DRAFT_1280483 [Lactifluus subvellereus]|nr:hypothetical protein BJV78DRAFT_1280483 [Lactifluus subvellereus]